MFSSVKESRFIPTVKTVADLTMDQIHAMERSELIQVIEQGRVPFIESSQLTQHDTPTLQRLAMLSRQSCMQQA